MYITIELSGAQNIWRIGRSFEAVNGFAASSWSMGATQMFITPSRGASHARCLPSGASEAPARLGLPKSLARSMSGAACAAAWAAGDRADAAVAVMRTPARMALRIFTDSSLQ